MRQVQFADNTGGNSMAVQQRTVLLKGQTFVGMTDRMAEVQCLTDAVLLRVFPTIRSFTATDWATILFRKA